jgi:DNA polymerase-3 subunit gamma/tau
VALARGGPGSVDVIEIDAASHGGVDDARDLRERASYGPAQSRYKIYIIDEAHMVTPQGFNALLKIVEEPPEHVKFVFATTEPEKVIGTIRSRTHHYPFRLVPPAKLTGYMEHLLEQEGVPVAPGVLSFVVRAGGGSVRDSLSVLDQLIAGSGPEGLTYESAVSLLGFTDGELLDATIDALAAGDGAATFRQVDRVIESGLDPRRFIEDLLERLRDLIIVAAVPEPGQVLRGVPEDQLERMRVQQAAFGPGALSRAADIVNTGLTEMTGATAPRMQLELICARILLPAASGEQGYAARLDRLERRLEVGGVPSGGGGSPAAAPSGRMPLGSPPLAPPVPAPVQPSSVQNAPPPSSPAPSSEGEPRTPASVPTAPQPAGGMDTDAIRRAWPQVLGRIFGMRRGTWTFVSQHAKVMAYDGKTLTLGISTAGLTNAFRAGNHADIVRQALIDELGVDAVVDGVHVADAGGPTVVAPPAGAVRPAPEPAADAGSPPAGGRTLEHNAGWGSVSAPAPDWATSPTTPAGSGRPDAESPDTNGGSATEATGSPPVAVTAAQGAGAVRESLDAARRGAPDTSRSGAADPAPFTDDAAVSEDDEDIELSGDVGRSVVEKVLGGRVISESED